MSKISKENEELVGKIGMIIILLPIFLVYFAYKLIYTLIVYLLENHKKNNTYPLAFYKEEEELLNKVDTMNGQEFENFISAVLVKNRYTNVITTKASGDHGADVLAELNENKYAFQCKRSESTVGSKTIGEVLRGMNYYKCNKGVVVTNNFFTRQAIEEANVNNIELWDRNKIIQFYKNIPEEKYDNIKSVNKNNNYTLSDDVKAKLITIAFLTLFIGIIFIAIKSHVNKNITPNTISFYDLEETIYNIAIEVVDKEEFDVQLDKTDLYTVKLNYFVKKNEYSYEQYNNMIKNEIKKIYDKLKDKELVWNTLFGTSDCSNVTIFFGFAREEEKSAHKYLGYSILEYSNDMWKDSYDKAMTENVIK